MRNLDINKQAAPDGNIFKKKGTNIGGIVNPIKEDAFLDTGETKYVNTQEYKDYTQTSGRGETAFPFQSDYNRSRALNQSNWEQFGHATGRLLPNTVLEIVNQTASILDVEDYFNADNEVGNWLSTWATEAKAAVDESMPIYQENPGEALQVGDFAWWMENGTNLVQSASAFAALGYATGGASLAGLTKGAKALKWLQTLGKSSAIGNKGKQAVQGLSALSNAALLNHAEGYGIGVQVFNETYNKSLERLAQEGGLSPEEMDTKAREEAAARAESAMNFNKVNILLNLSSASLFLKAPKLTRQSLTAPALSKSFKRAGIEGLQESAEESINMIAENQAMDDEYDFNTALNDVFSKEGAEAALLGFIGGAGQTGLTLSGRALPIYRDANGNRVSQNDQLRMQVVDQEKALQDWDAMSKADKFTSVTDAYLNAEQHAKKMQEFREAEANNDTAKMDSIKKDMLFNQAYNAFNTGTTEQLLEVFQGISKLTPEEAEAKGLDPKTYKNQSSDAINQIETLEGFYNEASAYRNREEVFFTKSQLESVRERAEDLNRFKQDLVRIQEKEFNDLGLDRSISFLDKDGNIVENAQEDSKGNIRGLNEVNSTRVKSLPSYKALQSINNAIENNSESRGQLVSKLSHITSSEYQNQLRENSKRRKVRTKVESNENKSKAKKAEEKAASKAKKANMKKEVAQTKATEKVNTPEKRFEKFVEEQQNKPTPKETPVASTTKAEAPLTVSFSPNRGEANSEGAINGIFEKSINDILKSKASNREKASQLEKAFTGFKDKINTGITFPESTVNQMNLQLPNIITSLKARADEDERAQGAVNAAKDKLKEKIGELSVELLSEEPVYSDDAAPLNTNKDKQLRQTEMMIDLIEAADAAGIDTGNFKELATYVKEILGESDFSRIYPKFKGLYILASGKDVNESYETLFLNQDEKAEILVDDEKIANSALPIEVYNIFEGEILKELEEQHKKFIASQGYSFYKNDSLDLRGTTWEEGHNLIAHLDMKYRRAVDVATTDKFNVLNFNLSKQDLDNKLNENYDSAMLDYNEINEGSEVTFIPLDQVVYEDGSIARADGSIERNGEVTKGSPLYNAPIGMMYQGRIVSGAFLHLPDWINADNLRGENLAEQKQALIKYRQKILNSPEGVTTRISRRTDGIPLVDKDGIKNKTSETMAEANIAIGRDKQFYTDSESTVDIKNYEAYDGRVYATFPVNKGVEFATPLQMQPLSENQEIVDTIKNAVELYLNNNANDSKVNRIRSEMGLDITTLDGLKSFLSKFIYVDGRRLNKATFEDYVNSLEDDKPIIQITDYTINFGIGGNWGNTITVLDRNRINNTNVGRDERSFMVKDVLTKLEKTLKRNMTLNADMASLNESFKLPTIGEQVTFKSYNNYNDFVKEHSYTSNYSVTLDNGTVIYTVQPSLFFEMNTIPNIKTTEAPSETYDNLDEEDDLGIEEDLLGDFAPRVLTEGQEEAFNLTAPDNLIIEGVPIGLQEVIAQHVSSMIVDKYLKGDKNAFKYLYDFKDRLSKDGYEKNPNGTDKLSYLTKAKLQFEKTGDKKYRKNIEITQAVIDNYPILAQRAIEKLQTLNNLKFEGNVLQVIYDEIEEGIETFQEEDTQVEIFGNTIELEEEVINRETWSSDAVFAEDPRSKISIKVKNLLSTIRDVNPDTIENTTQVYGMEKILPLDTVVNDVTSVLAYNNFTSEKVSEPSLDVMLQLLEDESIRKPYFKNVIETLKNADKQAQNQFVRVMSKHYTHHKYGFKMGNKIVFRNSDTNGVNNVIQNKWLSGLYASDLVVVKDNIATIDADALAKANEIRNTIVEELEGTSPDYNKVSKFFNSLGLDIDSKLAKTINTDGVIINKRRQVLTNVLDDSDGFLNVYLKNLKGLVGKDLEENHPFEDVGVVNEFARGIARLSPNYYINSFKDVRGRTYYGYSNNKFLVDRFKELKTDSVLLDELSKQPFSKNSLLLERLKNPNNHKYFNYYTIDGYSSIGRKGRKFENLSPAEQEEFKISLFLSQSKYSTNKRYIVNTLYPTTSDKSVMYGYSSLGIDFTNGVVKGQLTRPYLKALFERTVQSEVDRILAYQLNPDKYNYAGTNIGAGMFILFPELNTINELWHIENGQRQLKDLNTDIRLKNLAIDKFGEFVKTLTDDKIQAWKNFGFTEVVQDFGWDETRGNYVINRTILKYARKNKVEDTKPLSAEAYNYVANYLMANMNMYQLFITDPAHYFKSKQFKEVLNKLEKSNPEAFEDISTIEDSKLQRQALLEYYTESDFIQEHNDTFDNIGKRLAADVAPGTDIPEGHKSYFNIYHASDIIESSDFYKEYEKILKDKAKDYQRINVADAQEYTTLEEHLNIMEMNGDISANDKSRLLRAEELDKLSEDDLQLVLQPMKPRYVYNKWKNGVERRIYIKSSSFPLIKQLTKGLRIDDLRKDMIDKSIDRIVFDSALKVGGLESPAPLFLEGNFVGLQESAMMKGLSRTGMKIQQEIPTKDKSTITNPTQLVALITSQVRNEDGFEYSGRSYKGEAISDMINDYYLDLYKRKYTDLLKELDFNPIDSTIKIDKIQRILKDEGVARGWSLYDLKALDINENDFTVPLWQTGVSSKIESMLNSIVDNRIRKHKPRGQSYVLGSEAGMEIKEQTSEDSVTKLGVVYDNDWLKNSGGKLRPMRVTDGVVQPAEVFASFKFFDNAGNKLKLKEFTAPDGTIDISKLPDELLTSLGFRIPTQGLKSMAYIKIVGFLPEASGDLLIAPKEFIVQMGSDFDIDKLYALTYNSSYVDGKLSKYIKSPKEDGDSIKEIDNELLDLYLSVLKNPSSKVQKRILTPLEFGRLPELGNEIYDQVKKANKGIGLSEEYQLYKYNNARAGKAGIGVFSNDMRLMATLVGSGVEMVTSKGNQFKFKIGDNSSVPLHQDTTNTGKLLKTEVIEYFQSLSVDNENEQGLHKLNINNHTFDAIRALALNGFEEDVISYVINQPIIREYVRLKKLAEDSLTDFNIYQINETLISQFPVEGEVDTDLYLEISTEELRNNISEPNNEVQQQVLNLFQFLTGKGKELQQIQSSLNTFNAGIGKNLFYSLAKEKQFREISYLNGYTNLEKLIGNFIELNLASTESSPFREQWEQAVTDGTQKAFLSELIEGGYVLLESPINMVDGKPKYKNNIKLIEPTTIIGASTAYATIFNNILWKDFFPYRNAKVLHAVDSLKAIYGIKGTGVAEEAELTQSTFRYLKSFISSGSAEVITDGSIEEERARLFIDTEDNQSLATIVKDVMEKGLINNIFMDRLELDIRKEVLPSTIKFRANVAENIDEKALYTAFYSMFTNDRGLGKYNGIDYTVKSLAQDLVTAQLLAGGIQGANQFIKYIPINYLNALGFYNENNKRIKDFQVNQLIEQSFQHNPNLVYSRLVERDIKDGEATLNGNIIKYINDSDEDIRSSYISLPDNNKIKRFRLFKYNFDSKEYYEISTLGNKDFLEYSYDTENATSIIPDNNPNIQYVLPSVEDLNLDKGEDTSSEVIAPKETSIFKKYDVKQGDVKSISNVLEIIAETSRTPANKVLAQTLLEHSNKIADYSLVIAPFSPFKGNHSYNDKAIYLNPNELETEKEFEEIYLEEVIHAYTKKAIVENKNGEINRLKGFRSKAKEAVIAYLKKENPDMSDFEIEGKFVVLDSKIKNGRPLTSEEANILYPLYNDEEFVGRLFKSKKLQEILNDVEVEDKSLWDSIKDFIKDILNSLGMNIKKGSLLEYSMLESISLIKSEPSDAVKQELKDVNPKIRTLEWVKQTYNIENASEEDLPNIVKSINENISNVEATLTKEGLSLKFRKDFAPTVERAGKRGSYKEHIDRRMKDLNSTINKLEAQNKYDEATKYKIELYDLETRFPAILSSNTLTALLAQGLQDLQRIEEIFERNVTVTDAVLIKEITDYWSNLDTLLFEEDDLSSSVIPEFRQLENRAKRLAKQLHRYEEKHAEDLMKKYGDFTTVKDIFDYYQDINKAQSLTLDISRYDNPLLSSMLINLKDANNQAIDESKAMLKDLEEQEKAVRSTLKNLGFNDKNLFDIYRQKDDKGRFTGHIIKRYSIKYLKDRGKYWRFLNANNNASSYVGYLAWAQKDSKDIDLNRLFPVNGKTEDTDNYIAELKAEMGENHFKEYYKAQSKQIERYNNERQSYVQNLLNLNNVKHIKDLESPSAIYALNKWIATHSPYKFLQQKKNGLNESEGSYPNFNNHKYVTLVPKNDEGYDSDFGTIENNDTLYKFYNYYQNIDKQLQNLLPEKERVNLAYNGIPYLSNLAMNAYREKGMKAGLNPIRDAITKSIRISNLGKQDVNPVNDRVYRDVDVNLTRDNSEEIRRHITLNTIQYQEDNNGKNPSEDIVSEWIAEKRHELSQKQSYDLPAVLRMYSMSTLLYTHKARIEDNVKLIQNIMERQSEVRRDASGEVVTRDDGYADIREPSNSFKNTKNALDYTVKNFYGITKENEGVRKKKAYTTEEKKTLKEIEDKRLALDTMLQSGAITQEDYDTKSNRLDALEKKIGGVQVWSRYGDSLLKYVQLKGMGWNFMSSIANIGFGLISNYVEAAGGLLYSRKSLNKGYAMVRHSIKKSASFNTLKDDTGMKISNLMDKWDVLKDASTELYDNPLDIKLSRKHSWLEPYNLTKRSEFLNQAPLMVALMLDKTVDVNGKAVSIWDGFDTEGNWNTKEFGPEPKAVLNKLRLKLDQVIKQNHGNYDPVSSLSIKDKFLGRAVSQFRTWMFEGVANRFEGKKYDALLEEYRKGRYRTLMEYAGENGLATLLPVLKGIVRSMTFGKVFKDANFNEIIGKGEFSEVDAANLRKLMSEVVMYISIYSSYLLLKTVAGELDDEDDMSKYVINNLINQSLRLKTDIIFYLNPNEFQNLIRDLIPIMSIISDTGEWLGAVSKAVQGEDTLGTGVYAGKSRLMRESAQMLPFGSQGYKVFNYSIQTFDR